MSIADALAKFNGGPSLAERMTDDLMPPVVKRALADLNADVSRLSGRLDEMGALLHRLEYAVTLLERQAEIRDAAAERERRECMITAADMDAVR